MSLDQSVLVCDQVNPTLNEILEKNGLKVTYEPEITPEQLAEKIGNFQVVVVRSRTKLVKELIEKADKCKIIARVGVGLDNIDENAAKEKNIKTVEINPKKTDYSHEFDLSIRRTAKDVLGMLVDFSLLLER